MSANGQPGSNEPAQEKKFDVPKGKTPLKILMLHGYTQSGPLFSSKTKALSKLLVKALSPAPLNLHPVLIYPTGPHMLRPQDIPGYQPSEEAGEDDETSDNWGWFRKDEASGLYRGFEAGMHTLARAISEAGGVDGVMGFSQGGALAALLASALERPPRAPPASAPSPSPTASAPDWSWLPAVRAANGGRPLRFCVVYSGFWAPPPGLQWLYGEDGAAADEEEDDKKIRTPTLHYLGGLDSVVEEGRSRALIDRCKDPVVLVHPGGHYVPVARDWVAPLVGWLRQRVQEEQKQGEDGDGKESL
ncbi:serine hydrolase FSH [Xylariomycetidae sp. FL0641]|nr:serine hydrolase FSH [Xylariomycetidae sp. FL0641]